MDVMAGDLRSAAPERQVLGLWVKSTRHHTDVRMVETAPWIWWGKDSGAHRVSKARGAKTGKAWISEQSTQLKLFPWLLDSFGSFFFCGLWLAYFF